MTLLTQKQVVDVMLIEAQNELTKCKIIDRMSKKHPITGLNNNQQLMMGANQARVRVLEQTILDLLEIREGADNELPPLAKTLGIKVE